jgi:hypothetical protein
MKCLRLFARLVLLALAIPIFCRGQTPVTAAVNIPQLMASVAVSLNRHYVFPEEVQRMAAYLRVQVQKQAYAALASNPKKLGQQLQVDLQTVYHDPHLFVEYNPALAAVPQASRPPTAEETAQVNKYWKDHNYLFPKAEVLPGNIGYLPLTEFIPGLAAAQPTISAALRFVANTNALILDLRENMGGSPEMVSLLESYFFAEKTHMNGLINRSNKDTTLF